MNIRFKRKAPAKARTPERSRSVNRRDAMSPFGVSFNALRPLID